MKHVSILIPNGQFSIVNIAGTLQILETANEMYFQQMGENLFKLELVAANNPARDLKHLYLIHPTKTLNEISETDLIIVPAVHDDMEKVLTMNTSVMDWIKTWHDKGAEIASFCIGVYLLAGAGILEGRTCSTHWAHAQTLKERFPGITIKEENFITDDNGIYTSGGAFAFTNLVLYLAEKFGGRALSLQLAKTFMIDPDKGSQATFSIFNGQKTHKDAVVLKVQDFIESNYEDKFNVEDLSCQHAAARRTLERRFKKATGNSINEYVQRVRIEAAKKCLEKGQKTVSEVMYEVGYNDAKAFREVFKKHSGISPLNYRQKFGSNQVAMFKV